MICRGDTITTVNAILCLIILILGSWAYNRKGDKTSIFIGIAFGLFGLSHVVTLLGLRETLVNLLIVVRILAYLIVALALCKAAQK